MKSKGEQQMETFNAYVFAKRQNDPLWEEMCTITTRRKEIKKILVQKYRDYIKKNKKENNEENQESKAKGAKTKKFILEAIKHSKEVREDIWNPYYRIGRLFTEEELSIMSKIELNNLLKLAIDCLNAEDYIKHIELNVKNSEG